MRLPVAHLPIERLSSFIDRELGPAEERTVRAHLDACVGCSALVARLEGVGRILDAFPAPDCSASAQLVSAHADGEIAAPGPALAERHLRACDVCRARMEAWSELDGSLRALPPALPSARTDSAIAAIVRRGDRRTWPARTGPAALRAALAVATVIAMTLIGPFERDAGVPGDGQPRVQVEVPSFAGIRFAVLNPRTNTLYLAQPTLGRVAALDATTRAQVASINVGGRPTALALDEAANTILVMDSSHRTLTEIDGARNTVGATTTLAIEGTPTAIHFDAANGKIVLSGTVSPASPPPTADRPAAPPRPTAGRQAAPPPPQGFVAVIDGGTKLLETQRSVDAAPLAVELNLPGTRALLVAADATMLVDAATYRTIGRLTGGVAAAFSATGDAIAILSDRDGRARLSFTSGDGAGFADLDGRPVTLIALPDGDFAALLDVGPGRGRIAIVSSAANISSTLDIPLAGRDLVYDAAARRFSVAGESVASVSRPESAGTAPPAVAPGSAVAAGPAPPSSPAASATAGPSGSGAAAASPPQASPSLAAPTGAPSSAKPPSLSATGGLLANAPLAWGNTYRVPLPEGRRPLVVGGGGARIWFVDQGNSLSSIDTVTGAVLTFARLPADARIKWLVTGPSFVHAIDTAGSRIFSLDLARGRTTQFGLGLVRSAAAATVSTDDRVWLASPDATQLVSFDPRTHALGAVEVRTHRVNALFGDAAGGVWYAEESRNAVGRIEAGGRTVETLVPLRGRPTGVVADAAGNAWLGTDAGEVFSVRAGRVASVLATGGSITAVLLAGGTPWYLASSGHGSAYGPIGAPSAAITAPASLESLAFDLTGRGWSTDGVTPAFFVTSGTRPAP